MPTGTRPLSLIYNPKSGFHGQQSLALDQQIMDLWIKAGFDVKKFAIAEPIDIDHMMSEVLLRHQGSHGVVVAAGGDGTLNTVARYLRHTDIPMGILPLGTFNYVARVLNIPLDLLEAAQVIAQGQSRAIHVACVNQYIYLNNASLGLYPLFIQQRENYNRILGRFPIHAYTSALEVMLRHRKELKLEVEVDGQRYRVKTPLVFFGNNQLQLKELNLKIAQQVAEGKVAGVIVAKSDKLTLFKTLWQLMRGKLEQTPDVYSFAAQQVKIYSRAKCLTLAIDGEIVEVTTPLNISVDQHALKIMVPHAVTSV